MLQLTDKIFCPGCVKPGRFEDYVIEAAAAGFTGLSLWASVHSEARERGLEPADLTELLASHGIHVEVLEAVVGWAGCTDPALVRAATEPLCDAAAELGARMLCAAAMESGPLDIRLAARNFALICELAADRGLHVALEPLSFGAINHYRLAKEIVERADQDNGGFLVDSWHWFRTGADLTLLQSLPGDRIFNLQINDAPATAAADAFTETMHHRLLPGTGAIDYAAFFAALAAQNVRCAIGPEVFSDSLKQLDRRIATQSLKDSLDTLLASPAIASLCV